MIISINFAALLLKISMPIITLTSDYGITDYRIAAIKGRILSLNMDAKMVDISHEIQVYNLLQTSYIVKNAYHFFPKGSIHIICVDSFFHRERKNLIFKFEGHYFICADNGLLSLIFSEIKPEGIWEITYSSRFDDQVGFTATDIFAQAAVHLQNGGLPEVIGRKIKTAKLLSPPKAGSKDHLIFGEVIYIDNFGNIVSNIPKKLFELSHLSYESFTIKFRNLSLSKIYRSHSEVVTSWEQETTFHGKPAAIFNDNGLLELTIYKGSLTNGAKTLFGLNVGEKIYIEFEKRI